MKTESNEIRDTPPELIVKGEWPIKRVLSAPSAHSLTECLEELKFGRPAADQKYLQEIIEDLEKG